MKTLLNNKINNLPLSPENFKNYSFNEVINLNPIIYQTNEDAFYFNDSIWNIKPIGQDFIKIKFSLYGDLTNNLLNELKYLFLAFYFEYNKARVAKRYYESKVNNLSVFIRKCQELGFHSISEISDPLKFMDIMRKIDRKYSFDSLSNRLVDLKQFTQLKTSNLSINIHFGIKKSVYSDEGFNIKELSLKFSKTKADAREQTLFIPTKIHSKLIATCIQYLSEKKLLLPQIMGFLEEEYLLYESVKKQLIDTGKTDQYSMSVLKEDKTKNLIKKYNLEQFKFFDGIQKELRTLATACSILMLNFSGMRMNELLNIKTDGFKIVDSDPKLYVLRSFETKISGGETVDYITSPIAEEAFNTLTIIHSLARKYAFPNSNDLFLSSKHKKLLAYGRADSIALNISNFSKDINLVLDHEDVKESELINGPREEIKPGEIWPLASHQFRRTLIVNFVAHRLGTINAVKQQVKHMYATMTEYYAKNSKLAETFNLNMVTELAESIEDELLNEGVRQYKRFHYSEEQLAGIKGVEIMEERGTAKILSDNEIKQLFKTGLYKISKSMYGYCTKGNLCDRKDSIDPTFCGANCSTMIITKENALNWQKLYFKNRTVLQLENDLTIAGIPMNAAKTTMQSQNEVAKKIMNEFNIKYED